jgi:protein kinase-like protein/WD40 repeat protein
MPLSVGVRLGPYEVVSAVGQGGMGEVHRARDTRLNRDVAIKILLETAADNPERTARFSREAQVLASLNHPNIGAIYGLEESPSTGSGQAAVQALVMELVEGPTLAQRLEQLSTFKAQPSGLPIDEALAIAKQIADALEAAHDKGIIHRDLKPADVKVMADGTVKVLDFGLAKMLEGPGRPDGTSRAGGLTVSPTLTFRRPYLAPRVSPGGKTVAFEHEDDSGQTYIGLYDLAETSAMRRLTFGGHDRAPVWSPDGQWIAFQSDRDGDVAVFRQRADGSGAAERLTKPDAGTTHTPQSWSPDGAHLLTTVQKQSEFSLATLSMEDRQLTPFGNVESSQPTEASFSPDGNGWSTSRPSRRGAARCSCSPFRPLVRSMRLRPPKGTAPETASHTGTARAPRS